jgi:acyl-CoA thioester hydrolase
MHHGTEGWVAATNELILMNIDYESRRSAPWPAETQRRLKLMAGAHAGLPRPDQAGRTIAIKRR